MAQAAHKTCFVTIGATASFHGLIEAVLSRGFVIALKAQGYTHLLVQYGQGGKELFDTRVQAASDQVLLDRLKITGFDLDRSGLNQYMQAARKSNGVVISHAGSGTILDVLRLDVPLIVVPNEELLDNHQVELAEALAQKEYVVYGKLDNLSQALSEAEVLRKKQRTWPPPNSGDPQQVRGLRGVIEDEMGFLD